MAKPKLLTFFALLLESEPKKNKHFSGVPLILAVERWDPLTAHIDVCSKQSLIWAVGEIPKNCGFFLPLILMIAFSKH